LPNSLKSPTPLILQVKKENKQKLKSFILLVINLEPEIEEPILLDAGDGPENAVRKKSELSTKFSNKTCHEI